MYKNLFILLVLVGFMAILFPLFNAFEGNEELNSLGAHYAEKGIEEVGAANLVTAVVVTYRGLDTLGEVTILFLTAAIIAFFLKVNRVDEERRKKELRRTSELLVTSSRILIPVIFMFGIYVFINGHLTPGGGFQGGAIVASGVALLLMANPLFKFNHKIIEFVESVSGLSFILLGIAGLVLAGGFLDNDFLPLGTAGELFSAGAVPLIYIFVGLKVGAELTNILAQIQESQKEV